MQKVFGIMQVVVVVSIFWMCGCTELETDQNDLPASGPDSTPPPGGSPSPTPTPGGNGNEFMTEVGRNLEFRLGEKPSGTFYFEARGFVEEKYPGDESWMKPVFFWIYNDHSGFDYDGSGLLFQVLQLMHAGYYCQGGKLHFRNHREWLGELCYQVDWDRDRWYSFEIVWANGNIQIWVDGRHLASANTNTIHGPITAGIGWPPVRREGIAGLQYRNFGYY